VNPSDDLRQQIEDIALQLVVVDADKSAEVALWLPVLARMSATAQQEHAVPVVAAIADLERALRALEQHPPKDPAGVSALLQEGVAHLQKILEEPSQLASGPQVTLQEVGLAQDPELVSDFIIESRDHLVNIEAQLLTLEREPTDSEALNAVFRGFHTIKGLAGFLELWEIQKLSHEVETVLDRARNSQWTINAAGFDVILESSDYLRRWLVHMDAQLHHEDSLAPARDEALLARIGQLSTESEAENSPAFESENVTPGLAALAGALTNEPALNEPALNEPALNEPSLKEPPKPPHHGEEHAVDSWTGSRAAKPGLERTDESNASVRPEAVTSRRHETTAVKVDTAKLDYLVDMAGEMVIAESLVRHDQELAGLKSPLLQRKIAHLTRITAELQKTAMAMRLVPIGPLFRRMARLVRDLSRQFGKTVHMETQGDEIELDRTIVEELADPLMHMVRNALDHGIETPAERVAAGKQPNSRLLLKANHQAGQVVIEITDDGRGLNRTRIIEKAISKGLIPSADGLNDSEIYNLIFQPGFSTAAQVTNVSGRGVGMDVVRGHIEKLRGRIEIRSAVGEGATFLLKLPLTLAIIDGLVVGVGEERYIVPLFAVREMFRPTAETIWTVQQRVEMALVRGSLLPVVRLYRLFHVTPRTEDPQNAVLVVAEVEGQRFCVLVDELIGKQEVVIKSLGETFKNVTGVAGGAILGDGRVGLILDLDRIYQVKES
jgi:two-component system, chemotaxis family, sensor kinase CheA